MSEGTVRIKMIDFGEDIIVELYGPDGMWFEGSVPNSLYSKKQIEEILDEGRQKFVGKPLNEITKLDFTVFFAKKLGIIE